MRSLNEFIAVVGEITSETFKQYISLSGHPGGFSPPHSVLISSPGGEIGYTLAMLDDIDYHKRTTLATGINQSAAAVLATAGEGKRICTMDALFRFIHPRLENETVTDHQHFLHAVFVARLAARLKCERIEIEDMFDGEFISSTRAKQLGLIDEVISTEVKDGNTGGFSRSEGAVNVDTQGNPLREYKLPDGLST